MSTKKNNKSKQQNKGFKAGMIAGGVVALLYASVFSLFRISDFLLCGGLAILIGKIISIMASGLDLTTHNKQDKKNRPAAVEELPLSGNEIADQVIAKGQEMLHQIRAENDAITDPVLSGQMDELERMCVQIFKTVAEKPAKAVQIRKFMNYYLPTTLKMLGNYRTMVQRGVSATDLNEARATLVRGMGMVLTACPKQLDNLYKETILDVTTDIDVLEQMLKRDGFAEGELGVHNTAASAPTATSAQLNRGTPVINTPRPDDDFVSFYTSKQYQKK